MINLKPLLKKLLNRPTSSPVLNIESTELEVNKWAVSDFVTRTLVPITKNRPFPLDEQMLMVSAVCLAQPDLIFDWGTHIGKSARIFYETTKHFGIPCTIHSMDLPNEEDHSEHPGEERGKLVKNLDNVELHLGDGVETALKIYKKNKKKKALFYVDGDHSYESVYRELTLILKHVDRPTVLLHDTFFQSAKSGYNVGPNKAIKDALKKNGKKPQIISTQLGLPGMTLLYFK
jgi:cephalosporin hydroxylase